MKKYSVYWKKTGEPLIIGGSSRQCAKAMDLTCVESFYVIYAAIKNGRWNASKKWDIRLYVEDEDGN